jgi:MmpS family membrane protein
MSNDQQQPQYQQGPPNGWGPHAQPPAPKKKHTVRNIFLGIVVLTVLGVGGCVAFAGSAINEVSKEAAVEHTIVYKVGGTSKSGSLTYNTDGSGTTEQSTDSPLPWSKTLKAKGLFSVYTLMVQNGADEKGTVTCTIEVDGKVKKTATGKGPGASASCTHSG